YASRTASWVPIMNPYSQRTNKRPVPQRHKRSRTVPAAPQESEGAPQRIAKLLARAGVASRREIERMIAEGRIALNGEKLATPATLLIDLSGVTVDANPVRPQPRRDLSGFTNLKARTPPAEIPKGGGRITDRLPPGCRRLM